MEDDTVIQKILKKIGKNVSFTYPGNEKGKEGLLRDRVVMPSNLGPKGIPYWDVVDLIEFPEEAELEWIRIGYYRMKQGERLRWGSQTTITEPIGVWKKLFVQAASEKPWFKKLLDDVMKELQENATA